MPDPSAAPPAPLRARRWRPDRDLILSLATVIVSLCALGVSLVQTVVMRAQQYASVWPRLTAAQTSTRIRPRSRVLFVTRGVDVFDCGWRLENPSVGAPIPRELVVPVPACLRPATSVI